MSAMTFSTLDHTLSNIRFCSDAGPSGFPLEDSTGIIFPCRESRRNLPLLYVRNAASYLPCVKKNSVTTITPGDSSPTDRFDKFRERSWQTKKEFGAFEHGKCGAQSLSLGRILQDRKEHLVSLDGRTCANTRSVRVVTQRVGLRFR
jgi:hypothetical protein